MQVIKKFRKHQINVLCATNVLEEGIDLQMCNIVIMFDEPLSYSSYMQSKGRARMKTSTYLMMVKDEDRGKFTGRIQLYHDIEDTLKKVCQSVQRGTAAACSLIIPRSSLRFRP